MKVLVTGGGGFLGEAVCRLLAARGDTVRSLQRRRSAALDALGVDRRLADVRDGEAVRRAVAGCDAVVHCAAKAGAYGPDREYREINVEGTRNVLAACAHADARLVHTSSPSVVHDGRDLNGVDESAPYAGRFSAPYPRSKAAAERPPPKAWPASPPTSGRPPHDDPPSTRAVLVLAGRPGVARDVPPARLSVHLALVRPSGAGRAAAALSRRGLRASGAVRAWEPVVESPVAAADRGAAARLPLRGPDHIGMGLSDKPSDDRYRHTLDERVADLDALIGHLVAEHGAPRTGWTLVMHDWGGPIGMAWAAREPERVSRLVVLNTAAFPNPYGERVRPPLRVPLRLLRETPFGGWFFRRNLFARAASGGPSGCAAACPPPYGPPSSPPATGWPCGASSRTSRCGRAIPPGRR